MDHRDARHAGSTRPFGVHPARVGAIVACFALLVSACTQADGDGTADAAEDDTPVSTESSAAPSPEESTPTTEPVSDELALATAFWAAVAAGDRDAASSLVDPAALDAEGDPDAPAVLGIGRASTLDGQFDWYEAVGWQWTLDECATTDQGVLVTCRATASNAWSDALGVDPITATFWVETSDDGITKVSDGVPSFYAQYSPNVYSPFADWVLENHPEDAREMFNLSEDIDERGLALFEVNTQRFVEAHNDG